MCRAASSSHIPQVTDPVDERGTAEHDGQREKRRQAEVELQVIPHLLQGALRQQGGAAAFFRPAQAFGIDRAILSFFVLPGSLERHQSTRGDELDKALFITVWQSVFK